MPKKGPCNHCGIESTPLWRNGPKDKPVLCNACGSRYRLCGTLDKYLPKHCRPEYQKKMKKGKKNLTPSVLGAISLWKCKIPTRKRSMVVYRKMTFMEKLQRQLLNVLKYDSGANKSTPEEILLVDNVSNFIPSNEIGLGGILLI